MDELNEILNEDLIEDSHVEDVTSEENNGLERPLVETSKDLPPMQDQEITTPIVSGTDVTETEDTSIESYNQGQKKDENELGSCDCRSECRYNTGATYKYADYGYSG